MLTEVLDDRPYAPKVCSSCSVGEHRRCGPMWDRVRGRVLYCECPGWDDPERTRAFVLLPCLPQPEETRDAR